MTSLQPRAPLPPRLTPMGSTTRTSMPSFDRDLDATIELCLDDLLAFGSRSADETLPDARTPPLPTTDVPIEIAIDLDFSDDPAPPEAAIQTAPAYFVEVFAPLRSPILLAVRATLSQACDVASAIAASAAEVVIREVILPWEPATARSQLDAMRAWRRDGQGAWRLEVGARRRAID